MRVAIITIRFYNELRCGESTLTISPEYIVVYILTTVIEMKCFNMLNVSDT